MANPFDQFITDDQWKSLGTETLPEADREIVVSALKAAFKGVDPEEADPEDVSHALAMVKAMADDLHETFDESGFDADELKTATHASNDVLAEMNEE